MTCLKFSVQKPTSNRQDAGHEIPVHPWSKLESNIFYSAGDSYLLIVDYTSYFPIIRKLSSMTGKAIAHHMQSIFSEFGWPDTLVTDNGPCYTCKEFQLLMQSMSVNHLTSSPHYPQSNGLWRNLLGSSRTYSTKPKKKANPHTQPLWSIDIHLPMELYSHLCRFYKVDKLVLTYQSANGHQPYTLTNC